MKKLLALPLALASTLAFAVPAFATPTDTPTGTINACPPNADFSSLCNLSFGGPLIGTLITFAFVIAIVLALAWLIYGGIRWILSQGDKGKVDSARQHIIAALIGLIIVFLSYFLLNIVLTFFGVGGINNLKIPTINDAAEGGTSGQTISCTTATASQCATGQCTLATSGPNAGNSGTCTSK